ncbi:cellular communication network factor 1, like 2 [Odontesthes bonariensis]|uniref:cellular communication network factor 1, like 2 n=1 Tax=Odontesthes bonariensis TaxID=219752 RepID=UPI003F582E1A
MLRPVTLPQILFTLLVLGSTAVMAEVKCLPKCSCTPSSPLCPPGVSWVTDHCGCCKICARQFNEDCSVTEPCDHIKGLRCHPGAGGDPERGLCRAEAYGLPCTFNGRVYQHGEDFQPICQHQCTCMNGVVGCIPLCPYQVPLPQWRCSHPRLARSKGGCCEEWVCDDDNHISEKPEEPTHPFLADSQPHPNHISALLQPQLQPQHPAPNGEPTFRERLKEMMSVPMSDVLLKPHCFLQTTEWTQCSTTCGMGISSRVTNDNLDCRLVRETRLCQIQHCELQLPVLSKGRKCLRTIRPQEPVRITFAGCSTVQWYRPRTCGACTDGRCCVPSITRTVRLRFHCPNGQSFYNIMWIQHCSCRKGCHTDSGPSGPSISLYNDIHTFRD